MIPIVGAFNMTIIALTIVCVVVEAIMAVISFINKKVPTGVLMVAVCAILTSILLLLFFGVSATSTITVCDFVVDGHGTNYIQDCDGNIYTTNSAEHMLGISNNKTITILTGQTILDPSPVIYQVIKP